MAEVTKVLETLRKVPWRAVLVVLGLAFVVATVVSTVVGQMFLPSDQRPLARASVADTFTAPAPSPSLNQASIDVILKRNLFNSEGAAVDADDDPKPSPSPTAEAVKSDLPVKLLGTIYGGDPFSGIAMVENNDKRTINSFMVGDVLLKDATVHEIHRERIIVSRNNRLEYIEVEKPELARTRRSKKKAPTSSSPGLAPIATDPPPSTFKEDGFERVERDITMTQAYKQKLLTTDFTKVLQDAKASPNMVDGELRGFCLTRIRKDSIYEKAGLQNEDCVTEINGVPLNDTAQAIRLLQSLRNENEIEVRLNRSGVPLRFNLNIR